MNNSQKLHFDINIGTSAMRFVEKDLVAVFVLACFAYQNP